MNHHQNDLIARGFSLYQKVNLGGMGKDGFKTETDASLHQFQSLLLSEQRCFIAVCLRRIRKHEPGENIGVNEGNTCGLEK